ncbi:ATP-binding protein [Streptomyces sp. NPDC017202]|uniref:ATP-binding protein n=1 Tax=Streptomyces sp. NPDC017202 TaxID=3364981 RepID=UPI0037B14EBB
MKSSNVSAEPPTRAPQFTVRLSSTARGARLARRLACQQLAAWGIPYDSETSQAVALVTAELASNAVTHGRLPGRDFRLTLLLLPEHGTVRVEVTDTRPERHPEPDSALSQALDASSGRGLLLVRAHVENWGWESRDACTKTVWGEVALPSPPVSHPLLRTAAEEVRAAVDPSERSTLVN